MITWNRYGEGAPISTKDLLESFLAHYPFALDDFQLRAVRAIDEGKSVIVSAPTGAGKTLVAEFAIHRALAHGRRLAYTTPLKALSNQKFADFGRQFGADHVGILTGDVKVNPRAPILVMTTEILRNMALADVLAPAIRLADEGFVPDWYVAQTISLYTRELRAFPETARVYLRDGIDVYRPPVSRDGDVLRQPDLARTLRLIAKEGPDAFYRGAIAEAIDAEMRATGGFLTKEDMAGYEARLLSPLMGRYRGLELAFMPGATGGVTALEILNLLAEFPSAAVTYQSVRGLHVRAEAVRLAFRDRLRYLGDALRVTAPWEGLVSRDYAQALAKLIKPGGPRTSAPAPDPWKYGDARKVGNGRASKSGLRGFGRDVRRGGRAGAMSGPPLMVDAPTDCTTHIGVVDKQRNLVSLTNTAVSLFGSRMVVPGTGVLLQNGMIWFDPEPGRVNSIAPGKRPLVNMVPVLAFRKGEPAYTLGAPGGRKIVSVIPQVISNMADAGDSPQAAMEAPRLHDEGGELLVDDRVGEAALGALRTRKHPVTPKNCTVGNMYFARPIAIRITPRGLEAGLDPTSDASAAGL